MTAPGTVVGGFYRIVERIGQGGFGTVYLAENERLGKSWAIKAVKITDREASSSCGFRESELMKSLDHPGLPRVVDFFEEQGHDWIVMDYIRGESLESYLNREGPPGEDRAIRWGIQLCDILTYLHGQNPPIVYGDMKPANIILQEDDSLKLIDFGISARMSGSRNFGETESEKEEEKKTREEKEPAEEKEPGEQSKQRKTKKQEKYALGTRGYAAKEQYEPDGMTDERTDVYSLGVTLYRIATGHFPPSSLSQLRWRILFTEEKTEPDLSTEFRRILAACLRENPALRYKSAALLKVDLERCRNSSERTSGGTGNIRFLFPVILALAVISSILSVESANRYQEVRENGYQILLERASTCQVEEERNLLQKAVSLCPERPEAYLSYLEILTMDGIITAEEDRDFRGVLNQVLPGREISCRMILRENPWAYLELLYRAGTDYYCCYGETGAGSRTMAGEWFENYLEIDGEIDGNIDGSIGGKMDGNIGGDIADSLFFRKALSKSEENGSDFEELSDPVRQARRMDAQAYVQIAQYEEELIYGGMAAGESVTYAECWKALWQLWGQGEKDGNDALWIRIGLDLSRLVLEHIRELNRQGVNKEEICGALADIQKRIQDSQEGFGARTEKERAQLIQNLEIAVKKVEAVP